MSYCVKLESLLEALSQNDKADVEHYARELSHENAKLKKEIKYYQSMVDIMGKVGIGPPYNVPDYTYDSSEHNSRRLKGGN